MTVDKNTPPELREKLEEAVKETQGISATGKNATPIGGGESTSFDYKGAQSAGAINEEVFKRLGQKGLPVAEEIYDHPTPIEVFEMDGTPVDPALHAQLQRMGEETRKSWLAAEAGRHPEPSGLPQPVSPQPQEKSR